VSVQSVNESSDAVITGVWCVLEQVFVNRRTNACNYCCDVQRTRVLGAREQPLCAGGDCLINWLFFPAQLGYVRLRGNAITISRRLKSLRLPPCEDLMMRSSAGLPWSRDKSTIVDSTPKIAYFGKPNAARYRDFPVNSGRIHARRTSMHVRA